MIQRAILQGPTAPPEERTWFWQSVRWRQNQPFNAIPERHPVPDALPLAEAEETIAAITAASTRPGPSDDRDHWSAVG